MYNIKLITFFLPISFQALSIKHEIPMLLKRKKPKSYGTCQAMEGHFSEGDQVVLVDDVLMTGGTFVEDIPVSLNPFVSDYMHISSNSFVILGSSSSNTVYV